MDKKKEYYGHPPTAPFNDWAKTFIEAKEKEMEKANKLTWKQKYSKEVSLMNNEELLREYRNLLMDMPVKGVVSDNSQWRLQKIEIELKERLVNCGFLPPF